MTQLGNGFDAVGKWEEELPILQAQMDFLKRNGFTYATLGVMNNLAGCYFNLGRLQECLDMQKAIYKMTAKKYGNSHEETIVAGRNLALAYSRLDQKIVAPRAHANLSRLRKSIYPSPIRNCVRQRPERLHG